MLRMIGMCTPHSYVVSPSTSHDDIVREERLSSTNEIADVRDGRTTRKLSQQESQAEKDGNIPKSSGRNRKRHTVIGPMLPPKQTSEQKGNSEQPKASKQCLPPLPPPPKDTRRHTHEPPTSKGSFEIILPSICTQIRVLYSA